MLTARLQGISTSSSSGLLAESSGLTSASSCLGMGLYYNLTQRSNDPHSLSHDAVRSIREDREGVLWIGTWGGLARANLFRSAREVQQA
jgi:ligand-binding sensor domain-containing protein